MKLKFLILTLFITVLGFSQNKGTITGTVTDKDVNNQSLPFANVTLKGTKIGVNTDIDGKYSISVVPGNYVIQFSFVGYEMIEVPVTVKANETVTINKSIGSGSYKLEDVVVKASAPNRQKETALLLEQKNAVEIKQSIGAQELARKGVSDVATAVTKTTGITKQEGSGNIFVRGLGDRYNSTTMNGMPIPSNDPEKKNINLDIFSTDILEYVSIDKVYSSRLYGDFAGGNVDIISKDYKGKGFLKIDIGSKVNSNAVGNDNFSLQNGINSFGFSTSSIPTNALSNYNYNSLNLDTKNPIASTVGISGGKLFNVGSESKLNLFSTVNFGSDFTSRNDGTAKGAVNGSGVVNKNFEKYTLDSYNTNFTAMLNVGFKINNANKVSFNSVFINTSSLSKEEYTGFIVDIANDGNGLIRRNKYEKNTLWINQLLGDHKVSERSNFNWGVSLNSIDGDMPDRNQNIFRKEAAGYQLSTISAPDNHRYFQNLQETEAAANLAFDYKFDKTGEGEYNGKFTLGYNGRMKKRDFEATQFNFKTAASAAATIVDPNNLDSFYNQTNLSNGVFQIATFRGNDQVSNALDPQTYNGEQFINGGFLNTEYNFGKLTGVLGLRGEYVFQNINWNTQLDPSGGYDELEKIAFLPSLTLKYELNEKQNLRFGFSKTYTLPQFKERALFVYEDVTEVKVGNPDLYASDDYNFDLKWEMFPNADELISVTGFGKYIMNPINEVTIASSTNDISFINTGDFGYVAGAELEYRKTIFNRDDNNKLSAGINASYLYSTQELSTEKVIKETDYNVVFTDDKSKFTGASDLLLNTDISYFKSWNNNESTLTSTLAYTYFSDRVYAIGTNDRGNLVDKAFGSLDFITKIKWNKKIGIDFVVKNILDPKINRVQENASGDINVLSYKKGLNVGLNLNFQF
ncbi:TonB-dependent receptor domain-containing protein [Flavobacterium sp. RSSA_27]|uniref:TonB-dependent receptor n=1 Tax=Flavobacterium sp. RSSA_27 TaxID=3447667 RepID=UPI003F2B350C